MRYIDKNEVELDLPDDWEEKVTKARQYVEDKVDEARHQAELDGKSVEEIEVLVAKSRKKAINSKNIWSDLGDLLSKLSFEKCWYCETNELRSDNPIDHFRPKNRVFECPDHPGYWWLAFEWDNYRYSCTYCNSRRVKEDSEGGKHDHFPLNLPPEWGKTPGGEIGERPMLLDPCDNDDPKLLTFNPNGEARPSALDKESVEHKRADKSIELYHLNHKATRRQRKQIFIRIRQLVKVTDDLISAGIAANFDAIKLNQKELIRMIRPSCKSYSFNSAAKIYLRQFQKLEWVKEILDRD